MAENPLFIFLASVEDDDAPDVAWQVRLEEQVRNYNKGNGTNHDPYDSFMEYVQSPERGKYFFEIQTD